MAATDGKTSSITKIKDFVSIFLSVTALTVSSYSLYNSQRTHQDVSRANAIKMEYDLFNNLARAQLDRPLMTHLFAVIGEEYDSSSAQVATAALALNPEAKATLLLEERAMAHSIFTMFEETYYYHEHAQQVGDQSRAALMGEHLNYFTDALCNRRLLWYWDTEKGGGLGLLFAPRVQKYFQDTILKDCREVPDSDGPFTRIVKESKRQISLQVK